MGQNRLPRRKTDKALNLPVRRGWTKRPRPNQLRSRRALELLPTTASRLRGIGASPFRPAPSALSAVQRRGGNRCRFRLKMPLKSWSAESPKNRTGAVVKRRRHEKLQKIRNARFADVEPDSSRESDADSAPRALNDGVAEYVQSWELPLSVRRNLPELYLSIHVFSPNEAERFVLINGERYRSGDSIGEVEIVGINRDGAIVDFRSHRFLLAPR